MLKKPGKKEIQYRLDLAKEIVENVKDIDAKVFDVAQEMVWLGVTQMKDCGAESSEIIEMVKDVANHVPKSKIN